MSQPDCSNLLAQVAAQAGVVLPERRQGARSHHLMDQAMSADPNAPEAMTVQLVGGGSSGFDIGQLLSLGLTLAGQMNGLAGQMHGLSGTSFRGSNMNSLAQPPVRSSYGQGPPRPAPTDAAEHDHRHQPLTTSASAPLPYSAVAARDPKGPLRVNGRLCSSYAARPKPWLKRTRSERAPSAADDPKQT